MKKVYYILLFILFTTYNGFSQDLLPFDIKSKAYKELKLALENFNLWKYEDAVVHFSKTPEMLQLFPYQKYKYAIALWQIKDTINARKVFYEAVKNGLFFINEEYFNASPLIDKLSSTKEVFNQIKNTCYSDSTALFKDIQNELKVLYQKDQQGRAPLDTTYRSMITTLDSLNRIDLQKIIDKIGWPGFDEVGYSAAGTSFLIAQHSDQNIPVQKKCLELMKAEFYRGNIRVNSYAMIIDRYLVNTNQKQLFGSQVIEDEKTKKFKPRPCKYPDEIDFLRELFDFYPLAEYLDFMNKRYIK